MTEGPTATDPRSARDLQRAMRLSLIVSVFMLVGKLYAYFITNSAAILSDAAESVVHILAVTFAAFSLRLSFKPPDRDHPYGHDKISFFSAGIEGGLIITAAIIIIFEAIKKWVEGLRVEHLDYGMIIVAASAAVNAVLGWYLIWKGKKHDSIILAANGKHVLTDSWTSFGVVGGLMLVLFTGWLPFDPILAIFVALNIIWSGGKLIRISVGGLMDEVDPEVDRQIRAVLNAETKKHSLQYHELRNRKSGSTVWVDFHLLFPSGTSIEHAHNLATLIEAGIRKTLRETCVVTSHLEPIEDHERIHRHLENLP
ncbi:MAG TPA: cation diffusion facilitator family transporter [Bacteroidota bacterium]|nr:cation diffusion facilitator family transporter [Bacteroidota bacterium]